MKLNIKRFRNMGKGIIVMVMVLTTWGWGNTLAQERPEKTWKSCEEMSEAEKAELQIDCGWSYETPRSPDLPYAPAEAFPFKPPYTAEEIMYLADQVSTANKFSIDMIVSGATINTRGSLYVNQGSGYMLYTTTKETYWDRIVKLRGGDIYWYALFKYNYPPSNYGFGFLQTGYKIVPGESTKPADQWLYLPSLSKIRRIPSPRREDVVPQYDFTWDDSFGRPPFEYNHRIIGTDIIYPEEFSRHPPQDRLFAIPVTWKVVKLPWRNAPVIGFEDPTPLGMEKPKYRDIRPDGGVRCYVIESIPKEDYLPGYYCKRLITWVSIHDKLILRVEEYDHEDLLFFIGEWRYAYMPWKFNGREELIRYEEIFWDIRIDHMSGGIIPPFPHTEERDFKKSVDPQIMLQVDKFAHPINDFDWKLKDPKNHRLRSVLYPDKFPKYRGKQRVMGRITPEIQERIRKQDEAGRLVFDYE